MTGAGCHTTHARVDHAFVGGGAMLDHGQVMLDFEDAAMCNSKNVELRCWQLGVTPNPSHTYLSLSIRKPIPFG